MNPQLYNSDAIEGRVESKSVGLEVSASPPKVSIVIPAYNVADFICETLNSVFSQSFHDYEVILVDDGSSDSLELEKTLAPFLNRLIYLKQPNGGAAAARNTAIFHARGELLAFLDGDDIWEPSYLESQVAKMEKSSFDLIYADAMMFGLKPWAGKSFMKLSPSKGEVSVEKLLLAECNIITSGAVVKREIVLESGGFDEDREVSGFEDFDLWIRIAKKGFRIGFQKDILLKYRVVAGSLSGGFVKRAERGLKSLLAVKHKNQMTVSEEEAWARQLALVEAQLDLEKGKECLVQRDFSQAIKHFTKANKSFKTLKYRLIILLLKIKPEIVLSLFKKTEAMKIVL